MTIEERAIKFANDYSDGDSAIIQGLVNTVAYDSYNYGATEQNKIDIEKACKWLKESISEELDLFRDEEDYNSWETDFRKAMMEE